MYLYPVNILIPTFQIIYFEFKQKQLVLDSNYVFVISPQSEQLFIENLLISFHLYYMMGFLLTIQVSVQIEFARLFSYCGVVFSREPLKRDPGLHNV